MLSSTRLVLLALLVASKAQQPDTRNGQPGLNTEIICEIDDDADDDERTRLRCPPGHEILIVSAVYGRTGLSPCESPQTSNVTDCMLDVASVLGDTCDDNRQCSIFPNNEMLGGDPCSEVSKYLNLTFDCDNPNTDSETEEEETTPEMTETTTNPESTTPTTEMTTTAITTTVENGTTGDAMQPQSTDGASIGEEAMRTSTDANNSSGISGSTIGLIAGLVAAATCIACVLIVFLLRRRKLRKDTETNSAKVFNKYLKVTQSRSLPAQSQTALPQEEPISVNPAPEGQGPFAQTRRDVQPSAPV